MARWPRPLAAAAILAGLLCGCGGTDQPKETVPATVTDAIRRLSRRASFGDIDGVLGMLTDDARRQDGKLWIQFVGRTGDDMAQKGLAELLRSDRRKLEAADTRQFMSLFQEQAPEAFGRIFEFYYSADYEDNGRVLAYVHNGRGRLVYLAFARQADGGLKLMGEAKSKEVFEQLGPKLNEKLRKGEP